MRTSSATKQCTASLVSLLLHFSLGICGGFSAVLIPQLESKESLITVTNVESSWIASIPSISMPLSALFIGVLMESFGRKRVIQLAFIPLICGWALIWRSKSIVTLYMGRFMTGLAIGMDPAAVIYIAEINTPACRATLLSLTGPIILVGILISYIITHFLHWQNASLIFMSFSILSWVCFFFIPESPVWLVCKDNISAANESLRRLRDTDEIMLQTELEELIEHKAKMTRVDENFEKLPLMQKIRLTKAWKPFLILTCFFFLSQFSGMTFVFGYAINFYVEFAVPLDSFVLSMIHVIVCLCFSFLFTVVVERLNRKTLSALSAAGAGMSCVAAAVYSYVFDGSVHKPFFWFPVACVWAWVGFSVLGLSSLPWLMAGELFPTRVRGIMTSILWVNVYLYTFSSLKMYPLIMPEVRIYGILIIFSVFSFLAVIFSILIMPETKCKTLIEIEALW